MSVNTRGHQNCHSVRVHDGIHDQLEKFLLQYVREVILYMNYPTLFRTDMLTEKALEVRDKLVNHISKKMMDETTLVVGKQRYKKQTNDFNDLKASNHWLLLFMRRHGLSSKRGMRLEVFSPSMTWQELALNSGRRYV